VLQAVKHTYREIVWDDKNTEEVSLGGLMFDQMSEMDRELFKLMGSGLNVRINQGWIISHGMNNLGNKSEFNSTYLKKEVLGIILPRFIYPDKVKAGSHEKFKLFTGWKLADGVAMNLGIIGDAFLNFGKRGGVLFCLFLGIFLGYLHKIYSNNLLKYPDLLIWSVLFYFMLMRAGNEFYMIFNWYVKTGVITLLFFYFIRPIWIKQFELKRKLK
jgi:hypothetical protein